MFSDIEATENAKLVSAISKHVVVIFNPVPPPQDIFRSKED